MKKLLLLASLALLTISCRPLSLQGIELDPAAPPEYRLGWEDGCDSGISAEAEWTYKFMYGFKKRAEMAMNDQYKQGWNEGFSYCRFAYAASKGSGDFNDVGFNGGFD